MLPRRKTTEASERAAERRAREDATARLHAEVPALATLELAISEFRANATAPDIRHVRRFVVERAPALFVLPCTESRCTDGGHDITRDVLRSLRNGAAQFEGSHTCEGHVGNDACNRVLKYVGTATYRATPS